MNMLDKWNFTLRGQIFYIAEDLRTGKHIITPVEKNLVVTNSRTIMRDLAFGDNQILMKVKFGDMNLTNMDDLINVTPPELSDTKLINQVYEKTFDFKEKMIIEGRPSIQFTTTLEEVEANGTNDNQIITEIALSTNDDNIFTRKTHPVVIKNSDTRLTLVWQLLF